VAGAMVLAALRSAEVKVVVSVSLDDYDMFYHKVAKPGLRVSTNR
jgi:hypothetical protein